MVLLQQLTERQEIPFRLCDASKHPVDVPAGEIKITLWKNGNNNFWKSSNPSSVRYICEGWYVYVAAIPDVDTIGPSLLRVQHEKLVAPVYVPFTVIPKYPPVNLMPDVK